MVMSLLVMLIDKGELKKLSQHMHLSIKAIALSNMKSSTHLVCGGWNAKTWGPGTSSTSFPV